MASSLGRIKVKRRAVERVNRWGEVATYNYRPRLLRPYLLRHKRSAYKTVHIGWDGHRQSVLVHHMVLLAFHGPRPAGHVGCHNDSNPLNNKPDNLRWDTHHGNMQDRKRIGLYLRGEHHPMAKFTNAEAMEMRGLSRREAIAKYGISPTQFYRIRNGVRGGAA